MAGLGVDVAMARVRELPDAASRDMAMLALLGEWSGQSVTELVQAGEVGRFGVAGALGASGQRFYADDGRDDSFAGPADEHVGRGPVAAQHQPLVVAGDRPLRDGRSLGQRLQQGAAHLGS